MVIVSKFYTINFLDTHLVSILPEFAPAPPNPRVVRHHRQRRPTPLCPLAPLFLDAGAAIFFASRRLDPSDAGRVSI